MNNGIEMGIMSGSDFGSQDALFLGGLVDAEVDPVNKDVQIPKTIKEEKEAKDAFGNSITRIAKEVIESPSNIVKKEPSLDFKSVLLRLGEKKLIDLAENDAFDDGAGGNISFKDLEISSVDEFMSFLEALMLPKEPEAGSLNVNTLSDFAKKLIELDQNGGDAIAHLIKYYSGQKPLMESPVDTYEQQIEFLKKYYMSTDMRDKTSVIIKGLIAEGADAVADEVDNIMESLKGAHIQSVEAESRAIEANRVAVREAEEKRKKAIEGILKASFQLSDHMVKKISAFATDRSDNGTYKVFDKFVEVMNSPESSADLCLFLMDRDEYIKQKTVEVANNEVRKIHKIIKDKPQQQSALSQDMDDDKYVVPMIDEHGRPSEYMLNKSTPFR